MPGKQGPKRPRNLAGYLEALSRAAFSAGISWRVVDAKWHGIRDALAGFDPERVAELDARDIDALMSDPRVIRNRGKLEGTVDNAQTILELDREYGSFRHYLRSHGDYESTVADLKRQFRFLGDSGAYFFLWSVGEPVPDHEEWTVARQARAKSRSQTRAASPS
jgi:3-methyladenine DNA glycosylase Tag